MHPSCHISVQTASDKINIEQLADNIKRRHAELAYEADRTAEQIESDLEDRAWSHAQKAVGYMVPWEGFFVELR